MRLFLEMTIHPPLVRHHDLQWGWEILAKKRVGLEKSCRVLSDEVHRCILSMLGSTPFVAKIMTLWDKCWSNFLNLVSFIENINKIYTTK